MDLSKIKSVYMIGIKGVGMAMLAQYLVEQGVEVSGSDTTDVFMTDEVLKKKGIKITEGFDVKNIPTGVDLIVYSTAYNQENNVEVKSVLSDKHKVLTYAEMLAGVFNQKYGIAVVGSHGKTTTTAWLGFVMQKAGLEPNVLVGAKVPQFDGLALTSKSNYFVVEVDEYQNKLKYFQPRGVLLNNIEYDHPDFFPTIEYYNSVFIEFIKKIAPSGFLIANYDDPIISKIAGVNSRAKVISYAIDSIADYVAYDIKNENGRQFFKVKIGVEDVETTTSSENLLGDFVIQLSGQHNIYNALAVIVTAIELGVELTDIRKYLEEFEGTARRMQKLGEYRGAKIIDDYAHHPTEVKATISAIKQKYPNKKFTLVFHPHTYTRTKALLNDFAESFAGVDELIILDIYGSAREEQGGVHSRDLVDLVKKKNIKNNQEIRYIPTLAECTDYLKEHIERDDVVVLMGAGDVFRIGENLVEK